MSTALMRRARPCLGTFVDVRVEGLDLSPARAAIEHAFAEVADVHRLMSFHQAGSDLDRLHRARVGARVRIDARTVDVLAWALQIARASAGCFDPTIAAAQVAAGRLPRPASSRQPDAAATWRDVELCGANRVRLLRPLWIDLGGIAKGYAVDRAADILVAAGATQLCVNAGGDLRVAGDRAEAVHLRGVDGVTADAPVLLDGAALATSGGAGASMTPGPIDGRTHVPVPPRHAASVAAPRCVVADALTKVVLAGDVELSRRVLAHFGAQAWLHHDVHAVPSRAAA